ncbi:methyltransferase type 11 domain containing protein [Nitzschia inconspicua]|uniref:Methyltransferase type 11 domain containing protein n=1 Tax=Nitzschia inconspicua TaxID=303405 RepID=A0A9K3L8Z4_9STRA|nr:methyltransferase type 11 domain containing protein [Nitzschia inconspicua]
MVQRQKPSIHMALMALMVFASVLFSFLWTSVKNYEDLSSISKEQSSKTKSLSSFESLVKQNFVLSSQTVPRAAIRKETNRSESTTKNDNAKKSPSTTHSMPKIWVIYFPQYHPDPINDKNWGQNFTDWISLQKSPEKNRMGYEIPRPISGEYYDLRDVEPRKLQGQLAKQYGVDGFIYHHYWFYDRTHPGPNLAAPLLNMLHDGHPDVPFFLNWCATKWVNVWMGKAIFQTIPTNKNRAITLQEQYFDPTEDMVKEHYQWLSQFFRHPNYIKINNQPVMMLYFYDPRAIPILKELRMFAKQDGFDGIYWIVGRSAYPDGLYDPSHLDDKKKNWIKKRMQTRDILPSPDESPFNQSMTYPYPLDYIDKNFAVPNWCLEGKDPSVHNPFPQEGTGVITTFDNTPRREYSTSTIYNPDTPENVVKRFETNLYAALFYQKCCQRPRSTLDDASDDDRFVAINAWNEWAEGMAIEPSTTYGYRWLETIQSVKQRVQQETCSFPRT